MASACVMTGRSTIAPSIAVAAPADDSAAAMTRRAQAISSAVGANAS